MKGTHLIRPTQLRICVSALAIAAVLYSASLRQTSTAAASRVTAARIVQLSVGATSAGSVIQGTVHLSYVVNHKRVQPSCSILVCQFRPPYGTTVTFSQRPTTSKHPFMAWRINESANKAAVHLVKKLTFKLQLKTNWTVTAIYRFK